VTGVAAGAAGTVAALQRALAAENAAIYGYGVAGAYLAGTRRATATTFWNDHRSAADTLAAMLRARGATPAAADAAYKLPFPVRDARQAAALAAFLEDGVTAAYLAVAGDADAALRRFGGLAMQDSAVRAALWRGSSEAFPGFPGGSLKKIQLPICPKGPHRYFGWPGGLSGAHACRAIMRRGPSWAARVRVGGLFVRREHPGDPRRREVEILAHPDPLGPGPPEPPGPVLAATGIDVLRQRGGERVHDVHARDAALRFHQPGPQAPLGERVGKPFKVGSPLLSGGNGGGVPLNGPPVPPGAPGLARGGPCCCVRRGQHRRIAGVLRTHRHGKSPLVVN
jgi:hypothetical protein